jgi:hypothetical protein
MICRLDENELLELGAWRMNPLLRNRFTNVDVIGSRYHCTQPSGLDRIGDMILCVSASLIPQLFRPAKRELLVLAGHVTVVDLRKNGWEVQKETALHSAPSKNPCLLASKKGRQVKHDVSWLVAANSAPVKEDETKTRQVNHGVQTQVSTGRLDCLDSQRPQVGDVSKRDSA